MCLCSLFIDNTYPEFCDLHEGLLVTVIESESLTSSENEEWVGSMWLESLVEYR
jgi:hypothetical protein